MEFSSLPFWQSFDFLGLDPVAYQHYSNHINEEDDTLLAATREEERFKDCERLIIQCVKCKKENIIEQVLTSTVTSSLPYQSLIVNE